MLREMGSVLSFLTIIPAPAGSLGETARYMHAFPIVGAAVGLIAGALALALSAFLDPLLAAVMVAASLVIITGAHHADGLADFADGLMAKGGRQKKLDAMRDLRTGSAGVAATVLCLAGLIAALGAASGMQLFVAVLLGEILAKFAMVMVASAANPASAGSGSVFVGVMRDRRRLAAAFALTAAPAAVVGGPTGLLMLGVVMGMSLFVIAVSGRSFGGITGDVLGATNELARLAAVVVFVSA